MAARATRIETQVGRSLTPGEIFEITRARENEPLPLAHALHRDRSGVHASAGNVPRRLELAVDQQPPRCEFGLCRMDPGTWPRADLRLDRHVHPRHRFLFHSQVAAHESVRAAGCMGVLGALDVGREPALADRCLPVAMARRAAGIRGTGTTCIRNLLLIRFPVTDLRTPANRSWTNG